MNITIDPEALLDILGPKGEHWIQDDWESDSGDMCLHGAVRVCQPVPGDAYLLQQVAARKGWGTAWNDAESRTWADIKQLITSGGVHATDADLEYTFGPNWRPFVRLVRQTAAMTHTQAECLADARDAGLDAAWAAARAAVRNVARLAGRGTVQFAARLAVRDAAENRAIATRAVSNAAEAISVLDLVGQHDLEQHHLDTLLAPWLAVFPDALTDFRSRIMRRSLTEHSHQTARTFEDGWDARLNNEPGSPTEPEFHEGWSVADISIAQQIGVFAPNETGAP